MTAWDRYVTLAQELADIRGIMGLLQWDQQVGLPSEGAGSRASQLAWATSLYHQRVTSNELSDLVQELLTTERPAAELAGLRVLATRIRRSARVPASLVRDLSMANAEAFATWMQAREADDPAPYLPSLRKVFDLTRAKAEALDPDAHPYDALLGDYDPSVSVDWLRPAFHKLDLGLRDLLAAVREAEQLPALSGRWDLAAQQALHEDVVTAIGYRMEAGGLSFSEHPFTVGIAKGDVRITTHLYEHDLLHGLYASIHEAGHGIYEQGMPRELPGAGIDEAASVGLHESQSRFYENVLGRSPAFLGWLAGRMAHHLGTQAPSAEALHAAAMRVAPGEIRVTADEVTYNLHVIIRFQLEVALLEGSLSVDDLPAAWDDAYERSLGLRPSSPKQGVLQDVHWSQGAIGYFPSYTLGNLASASMRWTMEEAMPSMWDDVAKGDFGPVLAWLGEHVHSRGRVREADDLLRDVVGDRDPTADLLEHLWDRYGTAYGVR
jgi:carboxypeptidase Taq